MSIYLAEGQSIRDTVFTGGEPLHPVVPETLRWRHVDDHMPDSDISVLVAIASSAAQLWDYEPTMVAYYDGGGWVEAASGGSLVDGAVLYWCDMPKGP